MVFWNIFQALLHALLSSQGALRLLRRQENNVQAWICLSACTPRAVKRYPLTLTGQNCID